MVGILLLLGVVIITIGAFSVYYLGFVSGQASDDPRTDIRVEATGGNVTIVHNGGDTLERQAVDVIVENETGRQRISLAGATEVVGNGDDQFEPGEKWRVDSGTSAGETVSVSVVDKPSNSVVSTRTTEVQTAVSTPTNTAPTVTFEKPDGGETLAQGSTYEIEWDASDSETSVSRVDIEYSPDGGDSWSNISTDEANDGTYSWTVPSDTTSNALIRVNATDTAGLTASDRSETFTIKEPNSPPKADAGSDTSVPGQDGNTVQLNGSESSDSEGDTLTYSWQITSDETNGNVSLRDTGEENATLEVTDDVSGNKTVTVELNVSDGDPATVNSSDTVEVLVYNTPPDADAGDDESVAGDGDGSASMAPPVSEVGGSLATADDTRFAVVPPRTGSEMAQFGLLDSVQLDGTGSSDPDGDTLRYEWEIVDRDGLSSSLVEVADNTSARPTFRLLGVVLDRDRTVEVRLTVRDGRGGVDTDTVNVSVLAGSDSERPTVDSITVVQDKSTVTSCGFFCSEITADVTVSVDVSDDTSLNETTITLEPLAPSGAIDSKNVSLAGTSDTVQVRLTGQWETLSFLPFYRVDVSVIDNAGKEGTGRRTVAVS